DDWGGVSPVTPDHVNPERPWPNLDTLREITESAGFTLAERTSAHPKYVRAGNPWIDPRISAHVAALTDPATGLARPDVTPVGLPWQEPDENWESAGRVDLETAIDTEGRNTEARSDAGLGGESFGAFGDWDTIREQARGIAQGAPARLDSDVAAALRAAE